MEYKIVFTRALRVTFLDVLYCIFLFYVIVKIVQEKHNKITNSKLRSMSVTCSLKSMLGCYLIVSSALP